jgi:hypothetical protein
MQNNMYNMYYMSAEHNMQNINMQKMQDNMQNKMDQYAKKYA